VRAEVCGGLPHGETAPPPHTHTDLRHCCLTQARRLLCCVHGCCSRARCCCHLGAHRRGCGWCGWLAHGGQQSMCEAAAAGQPRVQPSPGHTAVRATRPVSARSTTTPTFSRVEPCILARLLVITTTTTCCCCCWDEVTLPGFKRRQAAWAARVQARVSAGWQHLCGHQPQAPLEPPPPPPLTRLHQPAGTQGSLTCRLMP
jgi:hypothetical protein